MIESLAARAAAVSARDISHNIFAADDPRTTRPISLDQQRKRAKELLRGWQTADATALQRLRHHPQRSRLETKPPRLADAQVVIARELGFRKWEGLKAHVDSAALARAALAAGAPANLDADRRTLHIRCGSDIRDGLAIAGFRGDYLSFAYPFVHGPAPQADREVFVATAAAYLASVSFVEDEAAAAERLTREWDGLEAARDYDRICFWFEHDSYDMLCLAFLLAWFAPPERRPAEVSLAALTGYPGTAKFHGLGHLPPDAFRVIWGWFAPVTEGQYTLGHAAWQALTEPSPEALHILAANGTPALPQMAPALLRHLQELPALANGLSLTEQLALQALESEGSMTAGRLFGRYTNHYEPLPFMGDLGFFNAVLEPLASGDDPAISFDDRGGDLPWARRTEVALTGVGGDLLRGEANWLDLADIDRWVGGVRVRGAPPTWCWDHTAAKPVLRR